jgi:hypothetical protein
MPRRAVITMQEIYQRRASHWEWHYHNRELAKQYCPEDQARIRNVISAEVPPPVMMIDGDIIRGIATLKGEERATKALRMNTNQRMMCIWYWSQEEWEHFTQEWQSLPEPTEDYYFVYDQTADAAILEPVTTRQKPGKKGKPELGTELVRIRYKSPTCT